MGAKLMQERPRQNESDFSLFHKLTLLIGIVSALISFQVLDENDDNENNMTIIIILKSFCAFALQWLFKCKENWKRRSQATELPKDKRRNFNVQGGRALIFD